MKKTAKRYTRKQLFVKWLFPSLFMMGVLYLGFTAYFVRSTDNIAMTSNQMLSSTITDKIYSSLEANGYSSPETDPNLRNIIQAMLNIFSNSDEYFDDMCFIADAKTYKPLMLPDDSVMLLQRENKTVKNGYRADDTAKEMIIKEKEKYGEDVYASVKAAYLSDDGRFIPETIIFCSYSDDSECGKVNFTDINTEGFVYTEFDESPSLFISEYHNENSSEKAEKALKKIRNREITSVFNPFKYESHVSERRIITGGREYLAVALSSYTEKNGTLSMILGGMPGLLILFIFLALIAAAAEAAIEYSKLKIHYDTEDFRKELTNTMAHDLKTPLAAASGYAENLLSGTNPDKNRHYTESILENINHMDRIITDVLELSKLESGSALTSKRSVSLNALTDEILKRYQAPVSEKKLRVTVTGNASVKADEALIKRAAENLIGNAVKFSSDQSDISIFISNTEYRVTNSFTGEITNADKLTDPFVMGDSSRSNKTGSGLGLSIVKNISELHGFSFSVSADKGMFTASVRFAKK